MKGKIAAMAALVAVALALVLFLAPVRPAAAQSAPPQAPAAHVDSKKLKKRLSIDLGDGITMDFVLVQAGSFVMGSEYKEAQSHERPAHKVTLTRPFYIGKTLVTQEQWEAVNGSNPSHFRDHKKNPVENVSWDDCRLFLSRLSDKVGKGCVFDLPTEAQWECACRAGGTTEYCYGDDEEGLGDYAWFKVEASDSAGGWSTHPVAAKQPNGWGLYDVHGNVWEWCKDWYGEYPKDEVTDPTGPKTGISRVLRGGSWNSIARDCRSTARFLATPSTHTPEIGLRAVLAVPDVLAAPE